MATSLTQETFDAWRADPVTQQVLGEFLRRWKASIHEQWETGSFQLESAQETAVANAQALGKLDILSNLIELDFDQFEAAMKEE